MKKVKLKTEFVIDACCKCEHEMSYHDKMYQPFGYCPHCRTYTGYLVCHTFERRLRKKITTWWDTNFPFFHREVTFIDKYNEEIPFSLLY